MSSLSEKFIELEGKMSDIAIRLSEYQQVINNIKNENIYLRKQLSVAEAENQEWKKNKKYST